MIATSVTRKVELVLVDTLVQYLALMRQVPATVQGNNNGCTILSCSLAFIHLLIHCA